MRPYFSERKAGYSEYMPLSVEALARLVLHEYNRLDELGYFQLAFGKYCVDDGQTRGVAAAGIAEGLAVRFGEGRGSRYRPSWENWKRLAVDELFDTFEFLHDHIAEPTASRVHPYNQCGDHVEDAEPGPGQSRWRTFLNAHLGNMEPPYRLASDGRIEHLPDDAGLRELVDEPGVSGVEEIDRRVNEACRAFFARGASLDSRRQAVRDLADVLEMLRPALDELLFDKDGSDLFHVANNFGIRHLNRNQKTRYDRELFYPWMFHVYLAAVHLVLRAKKRGLESARG